MKQFGYTESEMNIYMTLVEHGEMTGYEVSKKSGVPRSKVYNHLERLIQKGIVLVNKNEPKLYSSISTEEFVKSLKMTTTTNINKIEEFMNQIHKKSVNNDLLWQLNEREHVLQKVHHMIDQAEQSLYIQIWDESLTDVIQEALTKAEARLDQFVCILFSTKSTYTLPFKRFYSHGFEMDKVKDMNGQWINLVSDDEVLFGTLDEVCDVIWTQNQAMRLLSKEYIKHDAYTLKIIKEHTQELQTFYGNNFEKIRNIY